MSQPPNDSTVNEPSREERASSETSSRNLQKQSLPLAGIRVVEFCHTIMGPTAGLLLADLGADVIKTNYSGDVASFTTPDSTR